MSNESFAVSSDRDRFKWAYKHSRQLESLFTSMRSSASLHVIWAKSEEEEEEGTFWGKKAFLGTIVK